MKTPINLLGNGLGLAAMLAGGLAHAAVFTFDPDSPGINQGDIISTAFPGLTLSSSGGGDGAVYATSSSLAPTGNLVFGWNNAGFPDEHWGRSNAPALEALFSGFLAHTVSIDYLSDLGQVTLQVFDSGNHLLGTVTGNPDSVPQTLTFSTGGPDQIQSLVISVEHRAGADVGLLDNLVVYSNIPEPPRSAVLSALGLAGLAGWRRWKRRA